MGPAELVFWLLSIHVPLIQCVLKHCVTHIYTPKQEHIRREHVTSIAGSSHGKICHQTLTQVGVNML